MEDSDLTIQVEGRNLYRIASRQKYKRCDSLYAAIRNLHLPLHYILLILLPLLIGWIGSWSQAIKRGNIHYKAGAYDAALEAYQSAATDRPEDAISHYNLGAALYQKKQFEKAADEFRRSLDAVDPIYRAQGYYNLGNAQVQLNDIEGAIRSYKSALRLSSTDLDAKHNLELALEKLEQKSQQNHQSESGKEDKDQQEQKSQQQNRDEQEPNQQDRENPAESEQQQNKESSEREDTAEESSLQSEKESMQQPARMSQEDAIRLLEVVKDNEKEIQKKLLQKRFSRRRRPEKDW